jgi:hypothetical protein
VQNPLGEVLIFTLERVHDEAIVGEEMHPSPLIDDIGLGYLYQFEELLSTELNPVTTGVYG